MKKLTRTQLEKFLQKHATETRVLDIGAGGADISHHFPNRLMVDIDESRLPDIVADAHNLPFADGEFETVLCIEVLEHVIDPVRVLSELYRVLKPGGTLLLTTRFVYPHHDYPHDYWRFTRPNLERLFGKFNEVAIQAEAMEFTTIGILFERIILQTRVRGGKITKGILLLVSRFFASLDFLIVRRYGDITRTMKEPEELMTSGYYIEAHK